MDKIYVKHAHNIYIYQSTNWVFLQQITYNIIFQSKKKMIDIHQKKKGHEGKLTT